MSVFGFIFIAGSIYASYNHMEHTAIIMLILSCYYFLAARIDEIKDKLP